ncbi:LysR family transcriptional regulator [Ralstonia solanacearum]|uniref:LysR family transcriptional regulator n=1 Tax=Ralstonia solanacearum TaxID=305 RepID=UPI0005ACC981|nr:LysR family transcriptional regulator [Ralstonia solanacearum]AYB54338.1 LysR family transcriptional regulator [Ralstonia solanacearum]AYB58896.1 LysR family transcriptional regulator [Ralstonia solanacearum]MDB0526700.1 LysR family transcriptional regulator [Ralstonia solanacearum]MDB0566393.1 LysR family transcriptional regulator [Ralstonia solanacearum]MDB0575924.1 LysR family transcriptional regulator [Ralstonia solanacearum]
MHQLQPELTERHLRSLRIFCAVAQANGFAAAEKQLNMSKASISRHIREVEDHLGVRLCDRGPSGFELTEAGRVALDLARDALKSLERIGPEIDAVRGVLSGTLTIGMSEQIMQHADFHLSEALAALREEAPGVRVELAVMAFADLTLALRERRVQIAVRGMYKHDSGFNYLCLFNERQRVYTARDNLNRPRRLPLVYRQQPFVHDALSVHGFSRGPEATGLEAVAMFVATGHYVGLLPEHYADTVSHRYALVPLPGSPVYDNKMCAITETARPASRSLDLFLSILTRLHTGARAARLDALAR